jgi:hypothetical protein
VSRVEGFERMDVSCSIDDDPKFRALARRYPDLFAVAFTAYIGVMARSWLQGERLTTEEAWPPLLPYGQAAVDALRDVGLLDAETRIPPGAWERHFGAAFERRQAGRDRWTRYNEHRPKNPPTPPRNSQSDSQSVTTSLPRGTHAVAEETTNGSREPLPLKRNGKEGPSKEEATGIYGSLVDTLHSRGLSALGDSPPNEAES